VGSLVNGLMPSRAFVAGFFMTMNLASPGTTNAPVFLSSRQFPHPFQEAGPADRGDSGGSVFANPVLVGEDGEIIAGHGRVEAAS
jgi:hypothetical protein